MRIAPSVHRLGPGLINSYLLEDGGQVTIVDAALSGLWGALLAELEAMGRSLDDVRALVLTHAHPDHLGFAERLRRERGVPVYVHAADAPLARGGGGGNRAGWGPTRIGPLLRFLLYAAPRGGLRTQPVSEVATLSDGATLNVPGAPRVIHLPGHSPGSVALHVPTLASLFVGDALVTLRVTTGEVGPQLSPFTADAAQARASLDRLAGLGLEAQWVLPGHGEPWTGGLAEALRRVRTGAPHPEATAR
jgi:glyoxylase-like metal-dependent hydrolase (beta-lactamase superfamily II)